MAEVISRLLALVLTALACSASSAFAGDKCESLKAAHKLIYQQLEQSVSCAPGTMTNPDLINVKMNVCTYSAEGVVIQLVGARDLSLAKLRTGYGGSGFYILAVGTQMIVRAFENKCGLALYVKKKYVDIREWCFDDGVITLNVRVYSDREYQAGVCSGLQQAQ